MTLPENLGALLATQQAEPTRATAASDQLSTTTSARARKTLISACVGMAHGSIFSLSGQTTGDSDPDQSQTDQRGQHDGCEEDNEENHSERLKHSACSLFREAFCASAHALAT
jgi:hypothetical protein